MELQNVTEGQKWKKWKKWDRRNGNGNGKGYNAPLNWQEHGKVIIQSPWNQNL